MQSDLPQTKKILKSLAPDAEAGFTLIEAIISIVFMWIVAFGVGIRIYSGG